MTYNTQREKLILPEYGRGVQKMVDICLAVEDRRQRQRCAQTIVGIMAAMNPAGRHQPDFQRKLWDQLAIMSGYQLDVDYPFDVVHAQDMAARPRPLRYPMKRIRYRHYGHLTEAFNQQLAQMPEGPRRSELASRMANFMKRSLYNWNRDAMDEAKVAADLAAYTGGHVRLPQHFRYAPVATGFMPGSNASKKKRRKG